MIKMIRGVVQSVTTAAGKLMRFSATGRIGETIQKREAMQQYGLASSPRVGSECIILREGNHIVMVASDDRRYRMSLESGAVCLYAADSSTVKSKILLRPGGQIEVTCSSLTVTATSINLGGSSGLQALVDERIVDIINKHVHAASGAPPSVGAVPGTLLPIAAAVTTATTKAK
jgi:phage gp45-like